MSGTHRPSITYERANELKAWAERITGRNITSHSQAVRVMIRYLELLDGEIPTCPQCHARTNVKTLDVVDRFQCPECYTKYQWHEAILGPSDGQPDPPVKHDIRDYRETARTNRRQTF